MGFIRAELRFKNANLYNAIVSMGITMKTFSELVKVDYTSISCYINFSKYPGEENITKICDFVGESKQEMFYKYYKQYQAKAKNVINWDISESQFKRLTESSNTKLLSTSFKTDLDRVLATLSPTEAQVVRMYYIEEKDTELISDSLDLTSTRISTIRATALRKLRKNKVHIESLLTDYLK